MFFLNIIIWPGFHGYFYLRLTAKLAAKFSWWGLAVSVMINPILLNLFRAIDSSMAGLQKPTKVTIYNAKTT